MAQPLSMGTIVDYEYALRGGLAWIRLNQLRDATAYRRIGVQRERAHRLVTRHHGHDTSLPDSSAAVPYARGQHPLYADRSRFDWHLVVCAALL